MTVHYHRKPDMLAEGSDEPDCLPAHLQEALSGQLRRVEDLTA